MCRRLLIALALAIAPFWPVSCSNLSSSSPSALMWKNAEKTFSDGHIDETIRNLNNIIALETPFAKNAATWKALILAAQAQAYFELARAYESGSNENAAVSLRQAMNTYRSRARTASLALAEMALKVDDSIGTADTVTLEFPIPDGSVALSSVVANVRLGRAMPREQTETAELYTVRRAFLLLAGEGAGATDDMEQTRERFRQGPVVVARPLFLAMLGKVLCEQADLFAEQRMNEPQKQDLLLSLSRKLLDDALACQRRQREKLESWRVALNERQAE